MTQLDAKELDDLKKCKRLTKISIVGYKWDSLTIPSQGFNSVKELDISSLPRCFVFMNRCTIYSIDHNWKSVSATFASIIIIKSPKSALFGGW